MSCNRAVVKLCRVGCMLHWIAEKFDIRGTVVIIRPPRAVIASQLQIEKTGKGAIQKRKSFQFHDGTEEEYLIETAASLHMYLRVLYFG